MSENDMEEKILAYLLGECSGEEAFEVEKLCRENPTWQTEKIRLGQVIGLVEESLTDGIDASLPENECRLSTKQKEEIKVLLDKSLPKEEASKKKEGIMAKTSKTKNLRLIYWAPLAAAAVAALIAYWGNPEKDNAEKAEASYASVPISENNISDENADESSPVGAFVKSKTSDIIPTAEAEVALQESIADSANQTLALRTTSEIKALEQQAVEQLPDGKELMKRIKDNNVSSDQPDSDELLALAAAFSLPVPIATSSISPDLGLNNESAIERKRKAPEAINPDKILNKTVETMDDLNPEGKNSWYKLIKEPEESFIFSEKGDSLGKIKIIESSAGKFVFIRTNWPNKNRNFILEPGTYEIRLSKKETGTIILKGTVEALEKKQNYKFKISEAWELDKDEKRNPIPIDNLNP